MLLLVVLLLIVTVMTVKDAIIYVFFSAVALTNTTLPLTADVHQCSSCFCRTHLRKKNLLIDLNSKQHDRSKFFPGRVLTQNSHKLFSTV